MDPIRVVEFALLLVAASGGVIQVLRYADDRRHVKTYAFLGVHDPDQPSPVLQASIHNHGQRRVRLVRCGIGLGGRFVKELPIIGRFSPAARRFRKYIRDGGIFAVRIGQRDTPRWIEPGEHYEFQVALSEIANLAAEVLRIWRDTRSPLETLVHLQVNFTDGDGHMHEAKLDANGQDVLKAWIRASA